MISLVDRKTILVNSYPLISQFIKYFSILQSDKPCECKARVLSCVTGFRANSNGLEEATVFAWDGHRLEELSKLVDGYKIYTQNGTQIVGRGLFLFTNKIFFLLQSIFIKKFLMFINIFFNLSQ